MYMNYINYTNSNIREYQVEQRYDGVLYTRSIIWFKYNVYVSEKYWII